MFPTWEDWELHMTSVFPEVRIKKTIEVRGADCVSHDLAVAFCALFTGLLYDTQALDEMLEMVEQFSQIGSREERFSIACKDGLQGELDGRKLAHWAEKLVEIGRDGLARYQSHNTALLDPLILQVASGYSPGHNLIRKWKQNPNAEFIISNLSY